MAEFTTKGEQMTQLKLNENILKLKESATLAINLKSLVLRKEGKKVYHWGFGQSPFPVPQPIQDELKNRSAHKEYLPTAGLLELRQTISEYYAKEMTIQFDPENILISPGSKELLFQLIYLLEGDFFIPAPSWVSYGPQISLKGDKPNYIETSLENNYKLTPSLLDNELSQKTKSYPVLILNSPSNPTGQIYTADELKALGEVLKKYNAIVISDEIYGEVSFAHNQSPSLAQFYPEGTIITGGLSKAQSAGGYRLGYMAIPDALKDVVKPLKAMISETYSAVAAPIQYAAIKAWDGTESVKEHVQKCTKIHSLIGQYYHERFTQMGIKAPAPQGAFYMFISFDSFKDKLHAKNISTCSQLADFLLENTGVAILPGDDFYYSETSLTARMAFVDYDGAKVLAAFKEVNDIKLDQILALSPQIEEGLNKLEQFLNQL